MGRRALQLPGSKGVAHHGHLEAHPNTTPPPSAGRGAGGGWGDLVSLLAGSSVAILVPSRCKHLGWGVRWSLQGRRGLLALPLVLSMPLLRAVVFLSCMALGFCCLQSAPLLRERVPPFPSGSPTPCSPRGGGGGLDALQPIGNPDHSSSTVPGARELRVPHLGDPWPFSRGKEPRPLLSPGRAVERHWLGIYLAMTRGNQPQKETS